MNSNKKTMGRAALVGILLLATVALTFGQASFAPFYGKNIQSTLKLGRAQGVAMAAALSREIPITEYAPKKIKQSVTFRSAWITSR